MGRGATVRRMLAAGAVVVLAAGCGSYSDQSPPAGVDELVIPTPTPDPDDFVATIDNPWLPLGVGARWTYELTGKGDPVQLVLAVSKGPTIAGIETTQVTATGGSKPDQEVVDYYAQDRAGNVWTLGLEGVWTAGEDGAEAAIAMLADPRVGDGYLEVYAEGVIEQAATILDVAEDQVVIETRSLLGDPATLRTTFEKGVGMVDQVSEAEPKRELGLVAYDEPQS